MIQEMQTVLKEPLCLRISGGKLDFPRHASFVAVKIVAWWEADFQAAFKRHSGLTSLMEENKSSATADNEERVIKTIPPSEFVLLVVDTADKLLGKNCNNNFVRKRSKEGELSRCKYY